MRGADSAGVVAVYCMSDADRLTYMFLYPCAFAQRASVINFLVGVLYRGSLIRPLAILPATRPFRV